MDAHRLLNVANRKGQDKVVRWERVQTMSGDVHVFGNIKAQLRSNLFYMSHV